MNLINLPKTLTPIASIIAILIFCADVSGQDDLLSELQQSKKPEKEYTSASFKGTRVVNGHSIETKRSGELEFIISHRFGRINSGAYNLWGLDDAFIRIGLEYGVTDKLGIGVGRSSFNKIFDGYLKYKVLQQSSGPGSFPFTLTAFVSTNIQTVPKADTDPSIDFADRVTGNYQLLVARKINPQLTIQISPTLVHINTVDGSVADNDQFALGISGRQKITKSVSLNAEYFLRLNRHENTPYYNSLGLGIDIETGGHVFQLIFSNSQGVIERTLITETAGQFFDGDIHFGFNITRTFQLKK